MSIAESPTRNPLAEAPRLYVVAVSDGDQWLLTYACLWCRPRFGKPAIHTHPGGPIDDDPADGWRMSHCPERGRGDVPVTYQMVVRDTDEPPVAYCVAEWSQRDQFWAITVLRCPHCQKPHFHGGSDGPSPLLGTRVPHCLTGPHPHYELVLADPGLIPDAERATLRRTA